MGAIKPPAPAKLFVGLLSGDERRLAQAGRTLQREYGPADLVGPVWPFTATRYYRDELGDDVRRQFVFFERLIEVDRLAQIKLRTNRIEREFCDAAGRPHDRRPVNIDPGYMTLSKLVLATTKDYSHRLALGQGIYAEVTLRYHGGRWRPWPWTYADYAADAYHAFFQQARDVLKTQLAALKQRVEHGSIG